MTTKEKAKLAVFNYSNVKPDDNFPLVLVIERVIEQTIEECAKVADRQVEGWNAAPRQDFFSSETIRHAKGTAILIAERIRALK